jgi:hypothetical protein
MEHWEDELSHYSTEDEARDLATLSTIECIRWFETERPRTADNDNANKEADAACFESWALPDFMRK